MEAGCGGRTDLCGSLALFAVFIPAFFPFFIEIESTYNAMFVSGVVHDDLIFA